MTALFQPFKLKDLTLRNRIAIPPMCQYSATDGVVNDWHQVHYPALARGVSGGGSGRRRGGSTGARNSRRLLGSSGYGCCRRGGLSSSHARRNGGVGNHGLQASHALSQSFNR